MIVTLRPTHVLASVMPIIIGTRRSPELVGETPVTACRKSGMNALTVDMPALMRLTIGTMTCTVWLRNRCVGTIGFVALGSHHRNTEMMTMVPASIPSVCTDAHP